MHVMQHMQSMRWMHIMQWVQCMQSMQWVYITHIMHAVDAVIAHHAVDAVNAHHAVDAVGPCNQLMQWMWSSMVCSNSITKVQQRTNAMQLTPHGSGWAL